MAWDDHIRGTSSIIVLSSLESADPAWADDFQEEVAWEQWYVHRHPQPFAAVPDPRPNDTKKKKKQAHAHTGSSTRRYVSPNLNKVLYQVNTPRCGLFLVDLIAFWLRAQSASSSIGPSLPRSRRASARCSCIHRPNRAALPSPRSLTRKSRRSRSRSPCALAVSSSAEDDLQVSSRASCGRGRGCVPRSCFFENRRSERTHILGSCFFFLFESPSDCGRSPFGGESRWECGIPGLISCSALLAWLNWTGLTIVLMQHSLTSKIIIHSSLSVIRLDPTPDPQRFGLLH